MLKLSQPIFLLCSLLLVTPDLLAASYRGGAELLNPGAYAIATSASYFQTSGYYGADGSELTMPDGYKYQLLDIDLGVSYGLSRNLELSAYGRFRQVGSTLNDVTTTNSGPESLAAEIKYSFGNVGSARYALGAHYRQTLYSTASFESAALIPADELILGDAGSEYGVDLYLTYQSGSVKWNGRVGYSSPANNLSDEVTYNVEGAYRFTKLSVLAGVDGIYSLKKDEFTDMPTSKPVQATGVTSLFNSINREKIAPYVGANYALEKIVLGIKGSTVISGTSTDKGTAVTASLTWSTDGVTPEAVKIGSFKEYQIDGSVLKVSAKGNFVRIDQGLSTDVEKGMKFDIYQTDYFGGNVLVASGVAYEVGSDWSVIKLLKKYKEIEIKPGFAARGY